MATMFGLISEQGRSRKKTQPYSPRINAPENTRTTHRDTERGNPIVMRHTCTCNKLTLATAKGQEFGKRSSHPPDTAQKA